MTPQDIGKEKLLSMYRTMQTIRLFEEKIRELFYSGQIPGFVHVSIGMEAVAAGVCAALTERDRITSTHRGHGHLIAKGGTLKPMMAEIFGRKTGYCKGKGGSMHIVDFRLGILGANAIVGAGIPIATGSALASKLRGEKNVTVCFFGDGASNEGTFHESLNLAAVWKLPVIYVCENNSFAEFTPTGEVTAVRDIAERAKGHAIPGMVVDGNDALAVYRETVKAVERARAGEGPTLLECKTYRWEGHVIGEQAFIGEDAYRRKDEVEEWMKKCPIASFERLLAGMTVTGAELEEIKTAVKKDLDDAVAFAQESPLPTPEEALDDVFATPITP